MGRILEAEPLLFTVCLIGSDGGVGSSGGAVEGGSPSLLPGGDVVRTRTESVTASSSAAGRGRPGREREREVDGVDSRVECPGRQAGRQGVGVGDTPQSLSVTFLETAASSSLTGGFTLCNPS